jgi:hypothetical protein
MDRGTALRIAHVNVHAKVFDDEAVVLDMSTGTYFSLRGSAVDIWQLAEDHATPDAIADALAGRNGADPGTVRDAVTGCLTELVDAGLLRGDPALTPTPADRDLGPGWTFTEPGIESFTDMQDMLMLDPIHEVDPLGWPHQLDGA